VAGEVFRWIGIVTIGAILTGALMFASLWLYANLIYQRFGAILFRKSERRLSLASWHATKLMRKGEQSDDDWPADDFPINERPFYLSYQIGQRRFFMMLGWLGPHRSAPIKGRHPFVDRKLP